MKQQNIGDTVKVTKQGIFNNSVGKIVSVKYEIDFGTLGKWQFDSNDVLPNEAQISPVKELSGESDIQVSKKEKSLLDAPKINRVKKVKTDQPKEKRKYTRKNAVK